MMYCTVDDLRAHLPERRLIEVSDDVHPNSAGEVQASVVDAAIQSAGALIDSYVGQRYPLPLSTVPDILRRIAVNLAVCDLYDRVTEMQTTEGMRDRRKEATRLLELILDGKITLGLPKSADNANSLFAAVSHRRQEFSDRRLSRLNFDSWNSH